MPPSHRRNYLKNYLRKRFQLIFFILLFLAMVIVICSLLFPSDQKVFNSFTRELFRMELANNTLNMHFTIAHPDEYGMEDYAPSLPAYSSGTQMLAAASLENEISLLENLNPSSLKEEDRNTHTLLLSYLENQLSLQEYPFYSELLSPSSGIQSQLPILLAEYSFRNKQDVEDYLSLIFQIGSYFDGLITYQNEKASAGFFMPDYSARKVISQCDSIMSEEMLESGTHFLQTTFSERLEALLEQGIITTTEAEAYVGKNTSLLTEIVAPAYSRLADSLFLLSGSGRNENGLFYLENGQEYYTLLVKQTTGSTLAPDALYLLLEERLSSDYDEAARLLTDNETDALTSLAMDPAEFPLQTPEEILLQLQNCMKQDFPDFPASDNGQVPSFTVKSVSDSLTDYTSPAFYLTPPIDDITHNVIYVNEKSTGKGLDLYTTLAHEGYPGHLYQSVYAGLYRQVNDINPVRSLMNYGGYVEGWALYVEMLSFTYARDMFLATGDTENALRSSCAALDRSIQLGLYSLLDIAIHYYGADYDQVHKALSNYGINNAGVTRRIFEYITEEPANYLKYYIGYLEILALEKDAEELWGSDYTPLKFHRFFLDALPSDFGYLEKRLMQTR